MKVYKVLAMVLVVALSCWLVAHSQAGGGPKKEDTYIKVEVKGKLQTGIMAPGGETTGTIIRTETMTLELDFGKDKDLRLLADKLNDQTVIAIGMLTMRKGVAVKMRYIVGVTALKAADVKLESK
jgi:hypothetical protein